MAAADPRPVSAGKLDLEMILGGSCCRGRPDLRDDLNGQKADLLWRGQSRGRVRRETGIAQPLEDQVRIHRVAIRHLGHRSRASAKSPLGEALAYIARYRDGLGRFLTDSRVEVDSTTVERTIRPIGLNRKNALFAGHDAGAENRAVIASLIETCKMNAVDPHAWLAATLTAIVKGHNQSQIDDLLPWNYPPKV